MIDVCIIGSGIAGSLTAWELGRAGRSVLLLDTGRRYHEAEPDRYEMVRLGLYPWDWEDDERDAYEALTPDVGDLNSSRIKAVGGTTLHWNAYTPRLQPPDFEMRSRFGIARDWPFSYDDLEPYYVRAERELGVSGAWAPGAPPRSADYPLAPHAYSYSDEQFFRPAFEAHGLRLAPNPLAIATAPYDGRSACQGYATCTPMCPSRAKYTGMVHVRKAEATGNVEVRPESHVRRLRLASARRVGRVEYVDGQGREQAVEARAFVIACGGIETPRLLLLSAADGPHAAGLGNRSGLVGRTLMTHIGAGVRARLRERVGGHRVAFGTSICWDLHDHSRLPDGGNLILFPADLQGPTPAQIARSSGLWGEALKAHVRERYGFNVKVIAEGEMLPYEENAVALSGARRDRFGDPVPAITVRLGAFERAAIARGHEVGRAILESAGAEEVWTDSSAWISHPIGTTAMGDDPDASVCDGFGRAHELDNLYVAGSALFPTSSASHPTLTLAALALRNAENLARSL